MISQFNTICEYRINNPAQKGEGVKSNDNTLDQVKRALDELKEIFESEFSSYKGIGFKVVASQGIGYFPAILHLSILPPNQSVSDGVYTVACFDKKGKGCILGCAESKTNPKGLSTIHINEIGSKMDVDGFRETTKYNHCFNNPKEFSYPMNEDAKNTFMEHIKNSLDINLLYLNLIEENETTIGQEIERIKNGNTLSETEKENLIKCRRGQGKYRKEALQKYRKCVVTGLNKIDLLIASHIKPWRVSTNRERLDVDNCLLLAPHYDKLFDYGYITFENGLLKISPCLTNEHIESLGLIDGTRLVCLNDNMSEYLLYHNRYIFKKDA